MARANLTEEDLLYVADMLRAVAWVRGELSPVSAEALQELEECLGAAESALRRVAAEMSMIVPAGRKSN